MRLCQWVLMGLLVAVSSMSLAANTMRCGSNLVSLGDSQSKVHQLCGEPSYKNFVGYEGRGWSFDRDNHEKRYDEGIPVEAWSYQINDRLSYQLTFKGNSLKEISSSFAQ